MAALCRKSANETLPGPEQESMQLASDKFSVEADCLAAQDLEPAFSPARDVKPTNYMISAAPHDLAASMIRLHREPKAFSLAQHYAHEASARGDDPAHETWRAVVVVIAAMIEVTLNA
jgi:hypothetical protein